MSVEVIAVATVPRVAHNDRAGVPLVGIEEPEVARYPAAAGILRDCLWDAGDRTRVIVTSHSPDRLDDRDIEPNVLLAVAAEPGMTKMVPYG